MGKVRVAQGPDRCHRFRVRGFPGLKYLSLVVLLSLAPYSASGTDTVAPKNVLVLESFTGHGGDFLTQLKPDLRSRVTSPVDFYVENLESQRFKENGYLRSLAEALHSSYASSKLDLVIVANYPALNFAATYRDRMFSGVPIVFLAVDANRLKAEKLWPNVTGATAAVDIRGTIDLALRLHPGTNTIAVISNDGSEFEKYWLVAVQSELRRYRDRADEIDLVGLPTEQLLRRVAALPKNSVIFIQLAPQDSVQRVMEDDDVVTTIAKQRPTYCIAGAFCMGRGGIGTADFDGKEQVSLAVDMAARVLSGEQAGSIPIELGSKHHVLVDWRQLRHWNIPESALPPGSQVLYREPTFWERDRKYILAAIAVIFAQSLWILGLLWQRARKRKAEAVLRESEKRFELMADSTALLIWMCDQNGQITYLNHRRAEFTGLNPKAGYSDTWKDYVHPDDLSDTMALFSQALKTPASFSNEYRLRRSDGAYRWMFDVVSPRVNGDGSFAGFVGSAIDVTDQKIAQEALDNISGQLIEAQEKERTRIARDLHDDICQRLALVSMELEQASHNGSSPATKHHLQEIRQHCSEIAGDIQSLSHQLHSSKLDYLGLAAAIRGFCREFAKKHEMSVEFSSHDVPSRLPKDISLCLFRVAQEALQNAMKYSGASQFFVELSTATNELRLEVRDGGIGFDVEEAKRNGGLGLVSMQERVHLVRGRFSVESAPGKGAKIIAVAPLPTEIAEDFADGTDSEATRITGAA